MSVQRGTMNGVDRLDIAIWALIFHHTTVPKLKTIQDTTWSPEYCTSVTSLVQSLQVCSPRAFVNLLLVCRAWKAVALPQMFANMFLRFCQVEPLMKHLVTLDTYGPPLTHHTIRLAIGETHRRLGRAQYSLRMLLSRMPNLQVVHASNVLIPLATLEILSEHPHHSLTELIVCVQTGDPQSVLIMTGVAKLTRLRKLEVTILNSGQPQGWDDVPGKSAVSEIQMDHIEHLRWTIHGDFTPPEWSSWLWRTRFPSLRTFGISVGDDPKWDVASYLRAFLDAHHSVRELFVLGSARLSASVLGMRTPATTVHLLVHSGFPTSFTEWASCTRTLVIHGATPDNDRPPTRESLFTFLTCILACETSGSIGALRILRLNIWCYYATGIQDRYGHYPTEQYRILWANLTHRNPEPAGDIWRLIQVTERFQALGVRVLDADGLPAPVHTPAIPS